MNSKSPSVKRKSAKSSVRTKDKRSMLSKMSVGSLYKTLGIKGSLLGDDEEMRRNREDQIEKYKNILWNYRTMNLAIALYSGALQMIIYPNNSYLKDILKRSPASYTNFQSLTQSAWILKPLFGFISDTYYPFKSKIRFYIVLMCAIHILISSIFFFFEPGFAMFTIFVFFIYYCVGFVDALGEGMTAVITKMEIRLSDLKSEEEK